MIISDLNLLETVESADVFGGSRYGRNSGGLKFEKKIDIYVKDKKDIDVDLYLEGNTAVAEADAYGDKTTAQAFTVTSPYSSSATSISGTL